MKPWKYILGGLLGLGVLFLMCYDMFATAKKGNVLPIVTAVVVIVFVVIKLAGSNKKGED